VGLQYTLLRANESLTVSAVLDYDGSEGSNPPAYSDSADSDVVLDLKSWDFFEPSANFGLLITPTPWLEIGASLQPPITYKARGDLSVEFNKDHFFNTLLEESEGPCDADKKMESGGCPPRTVDDDVLLTVTVPLILRAGVQVQPVKPLKVEAAFTWTQWSAGKALEISDVNLKLKTKDSLLQLEDVVVTDDVSIPTGFVDAWSLRLGGDLSLNEWARVSLGGYYESSAVPAERQGVAVVDTPKWGLGAGASFNIKKRASIDVSFGQQFLADRTITDSQVRQITLQTNPLNTQDSVVGEGLVVGNGRFESRLTFISLGGTVYFGKAE
jgi:long-subunit fatty acid transport protein